MPPMRDMKPRGSTGFIGSASGKSRGDLGLGGRCNTIESDLVPPRQAVASKPLPSPPLPHLPNKLSKCGPRMPCGLVVRQGLLCPSYITNRTLSLTKMTRKWPCGRLPVCSALSRQGWRVKGVGGVRLWRQQGSGDGRGLYTGDELRLEAGGPGRTEDGVSLPLLLLLFLLHLHQRPEGGGCRD